MFLQSVLQMLDNIVVMINVLKNFDELLTNFHLGYTFFFIIKKKKIVELEMNLSLFLIGQLDFELPKAKDITT